MSYTTSNAIRRAGSALYDFLTPETQDVVFLSLLLAKKMAEGAQPRQTKPAVAIDELDDDAKARAGRLRDLVVRKCYEPELRRELVDRLVLIVVRGWATAKELETAVVNAKKKRAVWEATDGLRGREFMWQTLAKWAKGVYSREGEVWTQTDPAIEPPPRAVDYATEKEDDEEALEVAIDSKGRTTVKRRARSSLNATDRETTRARA